MTNFERGEMLLREAAFYYEQLFTQEEAQFARDGVAWVYVTTKDLAEHLKGH